MQVAVLNIRFTMDSIILLIILLTLYLLRPPPPAWQAHSLISARDMHLATRMFCCLCHFALRCEPSWAPMACARLQHNGESCLLLDSSRPSFCLSVPCPSRYKRPCTPHTRGLSLSDSLLCTLVQSTSVQFFCYLQTPHLLALVDKLRPRPSAEAGHAATGSHPLTSTSAIDRPTVVPIATHSVTQPIHSPIRN